MNATATVAVPDATAAFPTSAPTATRDPAPAGLRATHRDDPYLRQRRAWRQRLAAFLCCTVAGTVATMIMVLGALLSYELEPGRMPWLAFAGALVFAAATMIAACLFVVEAGRRPRRASGTASGTSEATTAAGWGLW